jgi:MerR family transcriptional regulator, light-induced transcriptional regulator
MQDLSVDAQIFARTASLFSAKRDALAPEAVEALAHDIVSRLTASAAMGPRFETPVVTEENVAAFCAALVQPEAAAALQFIEARRAEGETRQGVYIGYICAAARRLGEGWDEDRLTFLEVTTGTGHLYALMRALRKEGRSARPAFDSRRCALFATIPGEDHGIGITVAADLFRDAGWEIDLQTGTDHDSLIAHVERTEPTMIGLSLSTERRLDALVRLVVAIRLVVPHAIIGVAPAATLDRKQVENLVDIDLLFSDARSACVEMDRLVRLRR